MRRAPDHPDAYATLSEVFEARSDEGDLEKALQSASRGALANLRSRRVAARRYLSVGFE